LNNKIEEFKNSIKGKKIAVLGIGVSNTPLIKYLAEIGVDITAFDKNEKDKLKDVLKCLESYTLKYHFGKDYLKQLKGFDVIFRTPGMRFDLPELEEERRRGAKITSEMEAFFELCPAQIFAVTGSDGKTTTTSLIYTMLKEQGFNCWLGGNIGIPLLSKVEDIKDSDKVVLELSSFQLHTMKSSPEIAAITNISPNHLDVHKSLEEYIEAKQNIFIHQNNSNKLILNYDNETTRRFAQKAKGNTVFFSRLNNIPEGSMIENGFLIYKTNDKTVEIVKPEEILLPGVHNVENYLAAIAVVNEYVSPEVIRKVARTFTGVEHRIELVRELNGVRFYNDSIASSPSRTIAGLNSFNQKLILIAGGKDKGIPYDEIGEPIVDKVKILILIGPTAPRIEQAVKDAIKRTGKGQDLNILHCSSYEEVVKKAHENALEGDIVILSPASTSFDMFKNFEERGNVFKEIVRKLKV